MFYRTWRRSDHQQAWWPFWGGWSLSLPLEGQPNTHPLPPHLELCVTAAGSEGEREGGREGGRERGREGGREEEREGGRDRM